jgi:hypothetical protein
MNPITKSAVAAAVLLTPLVSSAAVTVGIYWGSGASTCPNAICGVAATIVGIINGVLVPLLFAVAFIVFLWGIAKAYIFSGGDAEKVSEGHRLILWGIVAFAVMISLWGLVNVVASTFGLAGVSAPPTPTSY